MIGSITRQITAGTTPPPDNVSFGSTNVTIGGVTIYNQSPLAVYAYIGAQAPAGSPNFIVPAYTNTAVPIGAANVCLEYVGDPQTSGSVFVSYTTDTIVSVSSSISAANPTKLPFFLAFGTSLNGGNVGDTAQLGPISVLSSPSAGAIDVMTPSQQLWVTDVVLTGGIDHQRLEVLVYLSNARTGTQRSFYRGRGRALHAFGSPFAAYNAALDAEPGDSINFYVQAQEQYVAPLSVSGCIAGYAL